MDLNDLTVEVRDLGLNRLGQIRSEDLTLEVNGVFNNVGDWKLALPIEHPLTEPLRTPGAGLIVTGRDDVLMSGPMIQSIFSASASDPAGTVTFEGVSDEIVLADSLCLPEPTNGNYAAQTLSHDVRTGPVETLLHEFVTYNVGPLAHPTRRKANLIMGPNLARGAVKKKSARFPILGNLLSDVAILGDLGFRVVQRGSKLVFETYAVVDRSLEIRLDVFNGTLTSQAVSVSAPGATQVIVAGQGELTLRQFYAGTNPVALAAEAAWGRRIERFVDQRQTDDPQEHIQAAEEVLGKEGFTGVSVRQVPADDTTMRFGRDWGLGDRVSTVILGGEVTAIASGYRLIVDSDGVRLGTTVGDPTAFNRGAAQQRRLDSTAQRLSALERAT